jgi:2-keto-4-pentenoate hydratase/2-oxohepta-3-ene-1,7-dioic acid hydratase in catechol pathway
MKIICVGRNYGAHAKELNNEVPEEPVLFMKPETALLLKRQPFFIPDFSQDVHHEVEVVVKISKLGKHIEERFAHKYYDEIGLGIDFTARDLQSELKAKGLPWEKAKAFDGSAVAGRFRPKTDFANLNSLSFQLLKNGITVQSGQTSDMLFSIDSLIAYISTYFTLKIGDLIFTGTPSGVARVQPGDQLEGLLEGEKMFAIHVK